MVCKYCFKKDHSIQNCTSIKCKICNNIGHAHWLCPKIEYETYYNTQIQNIFNLSLHNTFSLLQLYNKLKDMDKETNNLN